MREKKTDWNFLRVENLTVFTNLVQVNVQNMAYIRCEQKASLMTGNKCFVPLYISLRLKKNQFK